MIVHQIEILFKSGSWNWVYKNASIAASLISFAYKTWVYNNTSVDIL
jgi:hypothetical protein